jgi:hypothetical protein
LAESLCSAQLQTYDDLEVLVIDDGGTDDTEGVVARATASDRRLRYIRLAQPSGAPVARNVGLRESAGEFVQFLDSDDLLHREKFRVQVELLRADPGADVAVCQTFLFKRLPGDFDILWNRLDGDPLLRFLRHDMPWVTVGPLWRRTALERFGGHDESLPSSQDYEHATRALILGARPIVHRHPLAYYRVHGAPTIGSETAGIREDVHLKVFGLFRDLLVAEGKLLREFREELAQDFVWVSERAWEAGNPAICLSGLEAAVKLDQAPGRSAALQELLVALQQPQGQDGSAVRERFRRLEYDRGVRERWWGHVTVRDEPVEAIPPAPRYRRSNPQSGY